MGPEEYPPHHAEPFNGTGLHPFRLCAHRHHSSLGDHPPERAPRDREQFRHTFPPVLRGGHGRGKGRFKQCHCAEFFHVPWSPAHRPFAGRPPYRGGGGGSLLSRQRHKLSCSDRLSCSNETDPETTIREETPYPARTV